MENVTERLKAQQSLGSKTADENAPFQEKSPAKQSPLDTSTRELLKPDEGGTLRDRMLLLLSLFLTFSVLVANLKTLLHTVANETRWDTP